MSKYDGARIMGRKVAARHTSATRAVVRHAMPGISSRAFDVACRKWLAFSLAGVALGAVVAALVF